MSDETEMGFLAARGSGPIPPRGLDLGTYLVTDARVSAPRGVLDVIRASVAGGVSVVQIRDKTATTRELFELVLRASEITVRRCTLIVDDRVDVFAAARLAGAAVDGVHLGQSDLPVAVARQMIGPCAVLGLSVTVMSQLEPVAALPRGTVDYLGVGPIRPTQTKPDHAEPIGIDGFARVVSAASIPCVAIGGVGVDDTELLRRAGAAGIAVVSAICAADDPESATRELCAAWTQAKAER